MCLLLLVCAELTRAAGNVPVVAVSGEVVDADGSPLEAFTLTVYGRGRKPEVHAFDGTTGRLAVDLESGRMGIALDAPAMPLGSMS